jgi:hypothetical protein
MGVGGIGHPIRWSVAKSLSHYNNVVEDTRLIEQKD